MAGFSSDDKSVIERELPTSDVEHSLLLSSESVRDVFEVDRCCAWIADKGVTRVALQFPDYLLNAAPSVVQTIRDVSGKEVFVLGDTSYGECCVDEVAAQHLNADAVIHFGHTCLTPPQVAPVLYIFTKRDLNVGGLCESIREKFCNDEKVLLLYDVEYDHLLRGLAIPGWPEERLIVGEPVDPSSPTQSSDCCVKFGRQFRGLSSWEEEAVKNFQVVYVSTEKTDIKMASFQFSFARNSFYMFEENSLVLANKTLSRQLMKRYFLIEKTKDAERIGILVGTLSASNSPQIIQRIRKTIKQAGKKCYTFLVGKLNAPKLANFPEIDMFVLVACPETSFPDTSDFFQSVITPYELDVACNPSREWSGQYFTDFRDLLPNGVGHIEMPENSIAEEGEDDLPDVSLVTGKLRGAMREREGGLGKGEGELMVVNDKTVSVLHAGGGGQFLASRSWSGLEQKLGTTEVAEVVQGQTGIASGYSGEPTL